MPRKLARGAALRGHPGQVRMLQKMPKYWNFPRLRRAQRPQRGPPLRAPQARKMSVLVHFCSIRTCPGWPPSVDPGMEGSELFIYHDCRDGLGRECQLLSGNGKRWGKVYGNGIFYSLGRHAMKPNLYLPPYLLPTFPVRLASLSSSVSSRRFSPLYYMHGGNKLGSLNGTSRSISLSGEWVSPRVLAKPAEPFVNCVFRYLS